MAMQTRAPEGKLSAVWSGCDAENPCLPLEQTAGHDRLRVVPWGTPCRSCRSRGSCRGEKRNWASSESLFAAIDRETNLGS